VAITRYDGDEMKLNGLEVDFDENEGLLNIFARQYWEIKLEFINEEIPRPQTEKRFMAAFAEKYKLEMTLDDFIELKDYAENDYRGEALARIQEDLDSGLLTEVNSAKYRAKGKPETL
jgi:hypothetical protein